VPPQSGSLYILNSSAAYAWHLLRRTESKSEAIRHFAAHYGLSTEKAARDLELACSEWEKMLLAPAIRAAPTLLPPSPPDPPLLDAFSCVYRLFGRNIHVILHDADLIAEIVPRLEPLIAPAGSVAEATLQAAASVSGYHVFSGNACVGTECHPAEARVIFLQEFVRASQASGDWTAVLHAGACGTDQHCVVFPAPSHSGKTTLAAALMHGGLTFYTDDSVALQSGLLTVPVMPFALMIREGSWPAVSSRFPRFEESPVHDRYGQNVRFLHPTAPSHNTSASAIAIVFSRWEPGATTTIQPLDAADTIMRLTETGFWVAPERQSIQIFLDWIQSLPSYEMIYSDLDEATAFVKTLLPGLSG